MELRQLRTFVAVAEEQSFTPRRGPAVLGSVGRVRPLQTLELELGTTLIDRTSHPVSLLNDAGRALLAEARNTLAAAEAAEAAVAAVDNVRDGLRGTVELGIIQRRRGRSASPRSSAPSAQSIPRGASARGTRAARLRWPNRSAQADWIWAIVARPAQGPRR